MAVLQSVVAVVVLLGGLIFVHELGHYLVAKALGVKVLSFSIGFGPRLVGFRRGETEYKISVLPLGGYVKMAGEDPSQEIPPEDRGRTFLEQPPWKRLAIAFAGPAMNLIFPVVVLTGVMAASLGSPVPGPVVGAVSPGSPAERAGLQAGDRVRSVQAPGEPAVAMRQFDDLRKVVSPHAGESLLFVVERAGQALPFTIVPVSEESSDGVLVRRRGLIGVVPIYATALVAPLPGVETPLQPLDLVTRAGGREVRHAGDLEAALRAAGCGPVDLEVQRGQGQARAPVALRGVPTCLPGGAPAIAQADPLVSTYVPAVEPGSPAEAAGLRRGDAIAAIDGKPMRSFRDVEAVAPQFAIGKPITIATADGRTLRLVPDAEKYKDEETREELERPRLGIKADELAGLDPKALAVETVPKQLGAVEVVTDAWTTAFEWSRSMAAGIVMLATAQMSVKKVGGPLRIFAIAAEAAKDGLTTFLRMMSVISINLGLMNLLPIPVLDGGHIVTAALEGVTRRRLSLRVREAANWVGLLLILALMAVALTNDIRWLRG